jgi:DNA-binding response OmpR family regulator
MKVLIVDDEPDLRDSLRDLLEDAGYEVAVAGDGLEAVRQLTAAPPSLLILDLILPLLSGNEVYDVMQRTHSLSRVPVLITTSDPTRSPIGVPTLPKPFDADRFLETVALYTHGPAVCR